MRGSPSDQACFVAELMRVACKICRCAGSLANLTCATASPTRSSFSKEPADFEKWAREDAEIGDLLEPYREAASTPEALLRRDGP
jgi:hypothetical protein